MAKEKGSLHYYVVSVLSSICYIQLYSETIFCLYSWQNVNQFPLEVVHTTLVRPQKSEGRRAMGGWNGRNVGGKCEEKRREILLSVPV